MCIRIYGDTGTLDSHYNGYVRIAGDTKWNGTEKDDTFNGGAVTNVKNFVESIRDRQAAQQCGRRRPRATSLRSSAAWRPTAIPWSPGTR